jgi:phage repressor protein C with HTH and peptisase S24 domain
MELTTADIFAMLDARRTELGLSQVEVGRRAFNHSDGSALQNMKRGSSPTFENLSKLCATLGMEVVVRPRGESAEPPSVAVDGKDYARIPIHEATLSAGPGATNGEASIIDHMMFRNDWLKKVGVVASQASLARVTGESMAPGIQPGDLVLIDTGKTDIPIRRRLKSSDAKAKVYAFIQDGDARVKRIERPHAGVLVLLSDNPNFPAEVVTDERPQSITILGQVVWSGHVWR